MLHQLPLLLVSDVLHAAVHVVPLKRLHRPQAGRAVVTEGGVGPPSQDGLRWSRQAEHRPRRSSVPLLPGDDVERLHTLPGRGAIRSSVTLYQLREVAVT